MSTPVSAVALPLTLALLPRERACRSRRFVIPLAPGFQ